MALSLTQAAQAGQLAAEIDAVTRAIANIQDARAKGVAFLSVSARTVETTLNSDGRPVIESGAGEVLRYDEDGKTLLKSGGLGHWVPLDESDVQVPMRHEGALRADMALSVEETAAILGMLLAAYQTRLAGLNAKLAAVGS